ncbi:type VI secretion system-associated protein TagF [Methylomonas sp. AM2-LC]|uniref:type VI secretion system-associated protein TagF n=1 Tax=Methylomonas sp. AM2-LC TaxID=3153301 RepID=UPI0032668689
MSKAENASLGFYGKIPALGDFVSRRLSRAFIDTWDQWLQSAMRSSQQTLGDDWLSIYLVSPIWRFALSPGICGATAWAGVVMPSVDRVGRYYPLTLVQSIDAQAMSSLFLPESDWFDQLEDLALSVLDEEFDFDNFDQLVAGLSLENHLHPLSFETPITESFDLTLGKQAFRYDMDNLNQISGVFSNLSLNLLGKLFPSYSFWASTDGQLKKSRFLCCESLPPIDAYASFLNGLPQHPIWKMQTHQHKPHQQLIPVVDLPSVLSAPPMEMNRSVAVTSGWVSFGMTVVGNHRKHNEDAMLDSPKTGLWVVADGMGGHHAGDVASRSIVDALAILEPFTNIELQSNKVCESLKQINTDLCKYAASINQNCVVGSTVVILLAQGNQCKVVWAGDSRLYQFRQGRLKQISRDHSMVDEMMIVHNISREQASLQVGANVITRAIGGHAELELEEIPFLAEAGDRYLLCSDGLDKELSEAEISVLMMSGNCQETVENLINLALAKNGRDNITAIVADFL